MKIIAITQARTGSTRLPNKVLKEIEGKSLLQIHVDRIKTAKSITAIIVATTTKTEDNVIEQMAASYGVLSYRGSENDVLDRFYHAAKREKADYVIRLTSDCPLIDGALIDYVVNEAVTKKVDYCSNTLIESYPDGQDVEVFTFDALEKAWIEAKLDSEREHVTPYIKKNSSFYGLEKFNAINIDSGNLQFQGVRMTVDEIKDFEVMEQLINELGLQKNWKEYADYYLNMDASNKDIIRNEGYLKSINKENQN